MPGAGDDFTQDGGYDPSKPPLLPPISLPSGTTPPSPTTVVVNIPGSTTEYYHNEQTSDIQIKEILNLGWNTWARSIEPIPVGGYIVCTLMDGVMGACIAIGREGMEGQSISAFQYSLIIDRTGIKAHENGVVVDEIRAEHSLLSEVKIYRQADNSIVYVVTTEKETLVYTSNLENLFPPFIPLYVYGYLYSSGDKVLSAEFANGTVQYGSV